MRREERFELFVKHLASIEEELKTELVYGSTFQLLVAVILSAQCTDKRVNIVTPRLFASYPTAEAMAGASEEEIFGFIRSVSYPNSKTRYLVETSRALVERFGGEVPEDFDDLISLKGVGRKTANVIVSILFDKAEMPVDTHVIRVSKRLGLVDAKDSVLRTELNLKKHIPGYLLRQCHHWLVLHGRYVCKARVPLCGKCEVREICKLKVKS